MTTTDAAPEQQRRTPLKLRILGFLAAWLLRALNGTLRPVHIRPENLEDTPQYILTFWHAHLLVMLHSRFRRPIVVMSSRSKDGQLIAGAFEHYNVECVRGSSSRGASSALREMIRRTRNGRNIVFTPDGPTGPARVAKDGVVFAAQMTGLPIVPVAFAAKHKRNLASWDRMVVPYPFSRAVYVYGSPIRVSRDEDVEAARARVEQAMNALAAEADSYFTSNPTMSESK